MPQPKKKKTREEVLAQKRENERKRYERIKNDPEKLGTLKEKKKQYYLNSRSTGKIKTISEMTEREKRHCRKSWRARSSKYYKKKCAAKKSATDFIRANTPSSLCSEDLICQPSSSQRPLSPLQETSSSQSPRLTVARQKSIIQRRKRNKEIKEKDDKIAKLKAELNKYKKKVSKLQKKNNPQKLTPNSKMSQMADNPTTRTEVVKKALFGDTIEKQIAQNLKNLKTRQEKEISNKLILGAIVKERKVWKANNKVITYKKIWNAEKQKQNNKKTERRLSDIDDIFDESDSERNAARSPSILNPPDKDDILSCTSDVTLNIDDPDGLLLSGPVLNIDPKDLFPENEERLKRKRKTKDKSQRRQEEEIKKTKTAKARPQKKKPKANFKGKSQKERHETDPDDCYCIICGFLYKEDTSGQDWIQCIICHQWAQYIWQQEITIPSMEDHTIAYSYRVGKTSVARIIEEVADAICGTV
ncbi:axoneme-associated protein mst101(2)-like [Helicoverpa zea]|uniref:axoneme-associated protein mst101(2)-like n=1 Tax=Helicoverpa zea TaxID=7113 RepID=UPI001F57AEDA|nr:axoneme-associated protein mst101(2)-like [Helicoverpa zea]